MHVLHFPVTDAQFAKLQDFLDHGYVCQLQRFLDHGWSVKSGRVEWLKDDHASTTSNVDSINQLQDFVDHGNTSAKVHFPFNTEPHQLASQEFHQKRFQTVLDGLSKITAFTLHDSGALDVDVQILVETVFNMTSGSGCRCSILPHDAREGGDVKALVYAPGHGEFQVTAKV